MAYPITTTAGATLATIADGTVNSTATSLTLIGKNYAGYGNFLNENYVALLENFAYSTAPANALTGQLWYDTSKSVLNVYNGSLWKPISSSASNAVAPTNPVEGDLWWDSTNAQLKVWSGSAWITIGPTYTSTTGTSGPLVETIKDADGVTNHVVTKFYIENSVIAILSRSGTFTPQTAIAGFTVINPGFNLISASALTGSQFTGDVSNALTLQGVNASQFLRSDQNTTTAYGITAGQGITIGSDLNIIPSATEVQLYNATNTKDLNVYITTSNNKTRIIGISGASGAVSFANSDVTIGKTLGVTGNVSVAASAYLNVLGKTVTSSDVIPPNNGIINIGSSLTQYANVFSTVFNGNLSASYVTIGGNLVPTLAAVTSYVQTSGQNSQGVKTVSTSAPSGGNNGDVWYRI